MEKEEQIKMFAKSLKHQVGLALSENECYQFTKIVWNTAERETKDVKQQNASNSAQKPPWEGISDSIANPYEFKPRV